MKVIARSYQSKNNYRFKLRVYETKKELSLKKLGSVIYMTCLAPATWDDSQIEKLRYTIRSRNPYIKLDIKKGLKGAKTKSIYRHYKTR